MLDATTPQSVIDVRRIEPHHRHGLIFQTFDALDEGTYFELVNDHDPVPLHFQFSARCKGQFAWTYLEQGPDLWRVRIARV